MTEIGPSQDKPPTEYGPVRLSAGPGGAPPTEKPPAPAPVYDWERIEAQDQRTRQRVGTLPAPGHEQIQTIITCRCAGYARPPGAADAKLGLTTPEPSEHQRKAADVVLREASTDALEYILQTGEVGLADLARFATRHYGRRARNFIPYLRRYEARQAR